MKIKIMSLLHPSGVSVWNNMKKLSMWESVFFEVAIEFNHIEYVNFHMDRIQFNFVVNVFWKKCWRFPPVCQIACFSKNGNEKNMEIGVSEGILMRIECYKKMIKRNVKMSLTKQEWMMKFAFLTLHVFWTSNASFLQMNYTSVAMNVGLNSWALTLSLEGWSFFDARACILRMNSNVSGWFIARSISP